MTTVYLLRHGQSEANVAQVFTGQNDRYPLSLLGHRQADLAACYLASVGVQRIYASDLTRAVQTASHVADALCLPVHTDMQLREIYAGEWEGQHFADLVLRYPRTYASWRAGTCCNPTGGETASEAATRFYTAVERLCVQNADKVLLIVAHAMVIRLLKMRLSADICMKTESFIFANGICAHILEQMPRSCRKRYSENAAGTAGYYVCYLAGVQLLQIRHNTAVVVLKIYKALNQRQEPNSPWCSLAIFLQDCTKGNLVCSTKKGLPFPSSTENIKKSDKGA